MLSKLCFACYYYTYRDFGHLAEYTWISSSRYHPSLKTVDPLPIHTLMLTNLSAIPFRPQWYKYTGDYARRLLDFLLQMKLVHWMLASRLPINCWILVGLAVIGTNLSP